MPAASVTLISISPLRAAILRPSTSMVTVSCAAPRRPRQALAMLDVVLEFTAEILDEAFHRPGRGIAQCANGTPLDVGGDIRQHVEVLGSSLPVFDAMDHARHPAGAFAAWRALTAGLLIIEM